MVQACITCADAKGQPMLAPHVRVLQPRAAQAAVMQADKEAKRRAREAQRAAAAQQPSGAAPSQKMLQASAGVSNTAGTSAPAAAGQQGQAGKGGSTGVQLIEDAQLPRATDPPPGGAPVDTRLPPDQLSMLVQARLCVPDIANDKLSLHGGLWCAAAAQWRCAKQSQHSQCTALCLLRACPR